MRQAVKKVKKIAKIDAHAYTCKVRPHEHTSYFFLTALLVFVGVVLAFSTSMTSAWTRPGPAAGSVGLTGAVPGTPPKVAAVITKPTSGQRFTATPVTVSGTCPKNALVEILKNDIFAGSAVCTEDGTFSLDVDLLIGENRIVARVYDALNQEGPSSQAIVIHYDALPVQGAPSFNLNFGGNQLLLNTDSVFRGAFPEKEMSIPIDIIGGRAPYAVNIQWGDASNTVVSRPDNTSFKTSHTYQKAGTFQLSIQATDADGRVAFITVASIVNGQPDPVMIASTEESRSAFEHILLFWPFYAIAIAIVISFWLGEQRERRLLIKHGLLPEQPISGV